MADDVRQRLLGHTKAGGLQGGVEPVFQTIGEEFFLEAGALRLLIHIPAQRRHQSDIVEHGGTQVEGDGADLLQQAIHQPDAVVEPASQ